MGPESLGFIFLFFCSLGLGNFFNSFINSKLPQSCQLLVGLLLVAPIFILGNVLFQIPLPALTGLIVALSFVGFFLNRNSLGSDLKKIFLDTPMGLGAIGYFIVIYVFKVSYIPHHWDEFSYWLTHPKQVMVFGKILSADFYYKSFITYLPGLPALQVFNQHLHIQSRLNTDFAFGPNYLFGLGMVGLLWDMSKTNLQNHLQGFKVYFYILIVFIILFIASKEKVLTPSAKIEISCMAVLLFSFWALYYYKIQKISRKDLLIIFFVLCACGYSLKEFFILMPAAFALFLFFDQREFNLKSGLNLLKDIILTSSGFVLVILTWKISIQPYANIHDFSRNIERYGLIAVVQERMIILWPALLRGISYTTYVFMSLVPALGLKYIWNRQYRAFWIYLGFFFAVYYGTLMSWYFFSASDVEALRLASYNRYLGYFLFPLLFFGTGVFFHNYDFKYSIFGKGASRVSKIYLLITIAALYAIPTLGFLGEYPTSIPRELSRVAQIVKNENFQPDSLRFFDQGDDGFSHIQLLYYSLDEDLFKGKLVDRYEMGKDEDLSQWQLIWVRDSDAILDSALKPHLAVSCPAALSDTVLIRKTDKFECYQVEP